VRRLVSDTLVIAERNLVRLPRAPELLVAFTVQPIMFVLLFRYVFGGAIRTPGFSYADFLIPGIIVQNIAFGGFVTALGLNEGLHKGLIDRFRSLPIARSAFLVGRTLSDSLRLAIQSRLRVAFALVIGFSFHNGLIAAVGMIVVIVMFGMALTAFSAWVGLAIKDPETVQPAVFIPVLPLVFTSSAFAPVSRLPGWMQPVAKLNPVTAAIDTARGLALGDHTLYHVSHVHLTTAAEHFALAWVPIVGIFTALAVHRYRVG